MEGWLFEWDGQLAQEPGSQLLPADDDLEFGPCACCGRERWYCDAEYFASEGGFKEDNKKA